MSKDSHGLDLDFITQAINNDYDRADGLEPETAPLIEEEEPAQAPEANNVNIESPFLIVDFQVDENHADRLNAFRLYPDGIAPDLDSLIEKLEWVVNDLKGAKARAEAEAAASGE